VQVGKSSLGEASQQVLLETLPPVLVLHLERFLNDTAADGINKTRKPVELAPELEIPLGKIFLFSPCYSMLRISCGSVGPEIMVPVAGKSVEPEHYKLYGVLYQRGESASGGHYAVDVLHPSGDNGGGEGWLHIEDEAVRKVRHEDVFGDDSNEQVDDRCAYMLFYCHVSPTQT
jgi:ubiquitin carboxyl-terminal hydrolase 10